MNIETVKHLQEVLGVESDGEIGPITRKAFADKLIAIARKEIGTTELGDSNTGKRIREYQAATDLEGTGWPYCAAFICFIIKETGCFNESERPRTAAAFGFESFAREHGWNVSKPPQNVKRGDLVIFTYSHIGLAIGDSDRNGNFDTIEANTSPGASGSQRDGGGVFQRNRNLKSVRSTISL